MSNIYIQEPPTNGKVLLRTTAGDIDIELWSKEAPKACRNFIQLCMEEYYNNTIFHRVVPGFIVQGGDPTGAGSGGESIYGAPFKDEFHSRLRFNRRGLVAMANAGPHDNGSQFFFTLGRADELNNKHTIFGKVTGDTIYNMLRLAEVEVDKEERPLSPHKIRSSEVLFNPFDDIVPRPNRKLKKDKPEEETKKSKVKGTKNFNLLSFGEEAEEEEEEVSRVSQSMKGKSKSSHDLLKDDPQLSSVPAVKSEAASEERDLSEEEDHDEDADSVGREAASNERFQIKERIAKKLKIETSENAKQQLQDEETKVEKKTTTRRLTKLQILELRENQLKILPKTMSRLTQLERLDLGSNEFTEVPEVLEQLSGLKEFWMDGNRLTLIPGFIGTLKQLTYLDVSKNNIEVVEEGISGCESLQDLLLSSNSLQQLPETIGSLKKVTTLKIDENQLMYLPDSIGGLMSLEELDCSFNEIETLPSSVGQLCNMRTFAADHNFLTQLPSEIGNWKHVTVLFLHSNKLEFLPEEMGDMQKLKVINLSDNRLKNLPFTFTKLQQLTAMWLSDNQSKPLIPLQKEADLDTQKTVLTNYMFPQQPRTEDVMFISDNESFNPSLWEEQRKQRAQVAFECDEDKDEREAPPREGNLKRYPTPYPDELKNMVKTVQTIVHRLKDEESTEDTTKESKREGQTVSVKDVGVKTSEAATIKNKADERKQYSAGSSVQKSTEPEAEHSTTNSEMTTVVKTLQNTKTIVNHEDMLEQESEELSSDEEMKMAEMRPPLIETSINQPKVVALSNNKKDNSKDADSLSDEATHNSNQNNSNCSSPSRMSDSVSLNTESSQDISLCSPDKETHAAVSAKIRREDENLNNLLQNGGESSVTVEEKVNVQEKITNLPGYELTIEERFGLMGNPPAEESHKLDQINMNINKLVSEEAVPVPVERLQIQEIVSVKGLLNNNTKEKNEHLENGNKYPINKVNGHPEEAVQSPSKDKLMRSTTVDSDSAELTASRSTEDLSPQRSGPVMKSHSIASMDTGGLKIYDIVDENGSQQPNSVVKSAPDSADGKNIVRSKSATLLYDQPLQVFPGSSSSSDLGSSVKTVLKFDSNHNPESVNIVRGSVMSGAQMFCTPQYNIQYSSSATAKDTLWPQKQNTQAEQGNLPPSCLFRSDSTEAPSYLKHSANMNFSNHNNVRASAVYNTHQRMAGRHADMWAVPPNDRLLPGATRHTLQRQSSVSSAASVNVGDTGPSRRTQVPEGDYLTYRDLHSMGRAPPVMSGQQRPLSARTYSMDGPNVPRPQSARPSVNEIPERTMSVSDFNYSRTSPSKRSNPRVNSEHSLLDPPGKSKVPHDWREQVLRHIEAKKLEKSMLSRSFNSNYAAVSSFHYGSSRDLHGSQGSVALSVADGRGSGVHVVRHPQTATPGDQCQDEVFISGQQNYSSATLSLKDVPPDSMKKVAVQIPLTNGQMCQSQRPQANYSQVHHLPPQSSVARHPSREQLIDYLMLKVAHQPPYTQSQCSPRQSHELAKQEIRVRIDKDPELGFSISGGVGGRGNPFRPEDDGIFVTRVQPDGPASKLLQPGDKIIQANGYSFINIDHGQAVSLLKTFQNAVELIIVREVSS